MGKSQRNKGAEGEREVCRLIAEKTGISTARQLNQSRDGGCDIKIPGHNIEVKRRARIGQVYGWMEQSAASCKPGERPVVFCRADRKEWLVILPADNFLEMINDRR